MEFFKVKEKVKVIEKEADAKKDNTKTAEDVGHLHLDQ